MNLQQAAARPHVDGTIWIEPPCPSDGAVAFKITTAQHEPVDPHDRGAVPALKAHPLHALLQAKAGGRASRNASAATAKLTSIPIRVLFDAPESNVMARYEAWNPLLQTLAPVCVGDGQQGKQLDVDGTWHPVGCRGPKLCPKALGGELTCAASVRMLVAIEHPQARGRVFELRSNSINTYASILGQLQHITASGIAPTQARLKLTTWAKSVRASDYKAFGCATLEVDAIDTDRRKGSVGVSLQQLRMDGAEQGGGQTASQSPWERYGSELRRCWMAETRIAPDEARSPTIERNGEALAPSATTLAVAPGVALQRPTALVGATHPAIHPQDFFAGALESAQQARAGEGAAARPTVSDAQAATPALSERSGTVVPLNAALSEHHGKPRSVVTGPSAATETTGRLGNAPQEAVDTTSRSPVLAALDELLLDDSPGAAPDPTPTARRAGAALHVVGSDFL